MDLRCGVVYLCGTLTVARYAAAVTVNCVPGSARGRNDAHDKNMAVDAEMHAVMGESVSPEITGYGRLSCMRSYVPARRLQAPVCAGKRGGVCVSPSYATHEIKTCEVSLINHSLSCVLKYSVINIATLVTLL